jgi:hypothetical protein
VKDEDLEPFAIADGLLAKMGAGNGWRLTDTEIDFLFEHARDNCAKALGVDVDEAAAAMGEALDRGHLTTQAGPQFAIVTMYGRLLVVMTRHDLRGRCHPERN